MYIIQKKMRACLHSDYQRKLFFYISFGFCHVRIHNFDFILRYLCTKHSPGCHEAKKNAAQFNAFNINRKNYSHLSGELVQVSWLDRKGASYMIGSNLCKLHDWIELVQVTWFYRIREVTLLDQMQNECHSHIIWDDCFRIVYETRRFAKCELCLL